MKLYPLTFEPIYKERIWGGTKLKDFLNKSFEANFIGESWELSTVTNDVSVVSNGEFTGLNLNELIKKYPTEILGKNCIEKYGFVFPLLFKFLDAKEDLSIQVHPNDELAKKRHNSFGKTEMWYVMQADENARLVIGFKESTNKKDYLKHLEDKTLVTILNETSVKKGDTFFLGTGTVHAIGAGVLIAEIQQTSDITYRLYDWDRLDANGNSRELHTDLAVEAINYDKTKTKVQYKNQPNESVNLVQCPFFTTNILEVSGNYNWNKKKESFTVFMCTEGSFVLVTPDSKSKFKKGNTVLIPAALEEFQIIGETSLLEITI
ncbi:mannose-6-phosphate isomerase [Flavobacterium sp. F372]|uniref:Phosphohexomutase n=1 Tax=Flavobacterium bernardetii TaxID=2813823 RepID=A0ABR7J1Y4_9FLAO|nr:type I phosphomannose isomerase catalytic subunit [Flavobacterium bernardetii]MBC5836030.1 class I mannose-6-phosphate isomerase [Flavobacterium bernardetii]NHF71230.1 mannose-6-phosphate isomerase [Flavobacterium bernardetii]